MVQFLALLTRPHNEFALPNAHHIIQIAMVAHAVSPMKTNLQQQRLNE